MASPDVTTPQSQLDGLDELDYRILCLLDDTCLWKTKVHDHLSDHASVQTIGRRINQLHDRGLLETRVLAPDTLHRDLIIAYTTTDRATALLTNEICRHCYTLRDDLDHRHEFIPLTDCFSP